jgi:GntR family transcriptional regulator
MIVLDYRDSRPLYQQVKDSLRRMMLTGLLEPDEKLPSVRALATQLAINPNTIQRAYAELEAEGYIYSVAGRGSFVSAGDGEHLRRIAELTGRLAPVLEELKSLGYTREQLLALWEGGEGK